MFQAHLQSNLYVKSHAQVRRFVGLEQSMVALERIKEYSELKREPPEIVEPRPDASWPSQGSINCEDLVIRYAVCVIYPLWLSAVLNSGGSLICLTFCTA